jgi:hypothetical protein
MFRVKKKAPKGKILLWKFLMMWIKFDVQLFQVSCKLRNVKDKFTFKQTKCKPFCHHKSTWKIAYVHLCQKHLILFSEEFLFVSVSRSYDLMIYTCLGSSSYVHLVLYNG